MLRRLALVRLVTVGGILEVPDSPAESTGQTGEPTPPEDHHDDQYDDQQLAHTHPQMILAA